MTFWSVSGRSVSEITSTCPVSGVLLRNELSENASECCLDRVILPILTTVLSNPRAGGRTGTEPLWNRSSEDRVPGREDVSL